ncbi:MAG: hypothetical protein JWN48_189 [Myxococcaceae bacterium]|nr:hypothetical protein [Myxococcaceae bacterium]
MRRAACAAALTVLATALHAALGSRDIASGDSGSLGAGVSHSGLLGLTAIAHASDLPAPSDTFVVPPPPTKSKPRLALEVHTVLTMPLDNAGLCPRGAGCVMRTGGGVGVSIERRWPNGFGALIGYDAWFLDSDSVYELAVQQVLRGGMRYTTPTDYIFHPIFELSAGAMVLGDIFGAQTGGVVLQGFSGVEAELTESYGVRFGIGMRAFSHSTFRTTRDGVRRGDEKPFSESLFIEAGLTVM